VAEATIRARIDTVISAVSNSGLVYDYERWATDWTTYLDRFKTTISSVEVIRAWTITCSAIAPNMITAMGSSGSDTELSYRFVVRGYFGLDDENASEKTAIALVEDVVIALNADSTLRAYFGAGAKPLAECTIFEPRFFGDVLCHYAEITLPIQERDQT
jgi:hypothetical protein